MQDERRLNPFTLSVEKVVRAIPPGSVMTYGEVASAAGNPRAARQVARILHARSLSAALPWQRVAGAPRSGHRARIVLGGEGFIEQAALLSAEGLRVSARGDIDPGLPAAREGISNSAGG